MYELLIHFFLSSFVCNINFVNIWYQFNVSKCLYRDSFLFCLATWHNMYCIYIQMPTYLYIFIYLFIPFFDIALRILNFEYYMRDKTKLQYKQFFYTIFKLNMINNFSFFFSFRLKILTCRSFISFSILRTAPWLYVNKFQLLGSPYRLFGCPTVRIIWK